MKLFVLFLALIAFTAAQPVRKSKAEMKTIQWACIRRFNPPKEVLEKHYDAQSIEAFELDLCFLRELGVWSDSTGFNIDNIKIQLLSENISNKQEVGEALKNCFDAKREGETPLQWAYRDYKCFDIVPEVRKTEH